MLDVRRLVLLREVAIRGTLAAAAEALAYSPSAVSQQLAVLEREAGVELLRKAGRRVQLTPQAEILVEAAGEVMALLERAEAALAASGESVTGRVRVAVFQSAALALMPGALRAVADRFPEVRIASVVRSLRTSPGSQEVEWPGYCSATTRSNSRAHDVSCSAPSGSRCTISIRTSGKRSATARSAPGMSASAADWNTATRTRP
ncbi:LysR family transcriptional regulator, partial [Rathayibacter sp. AY1F7]|uniref:LysR family transcriptional regulator n=1 Tax=Rathayibacter sp. AY1F7 TaxID=2080561 RepID=UPI000D478898